MAKIKGFVLATACAGFAACGPVVSEEDIQGEDPAGSAVPSANGETAAGEWLTDFHQALAEADETDRPVLINITGSDWCPPCMMLKQNVFDTDEFQRYAGENLVLLEVDFPRQTELPEEQQEHNAAIAELYGAESFPTLILVDDEAQEQKRMVGLEARDPESFIRWVEG